MQVRLLELNVVWGNLRLEDADLLVLPLLLQLKDVNKEVNRNVIRCVLLRRHFDFLDIKCHFKEG